MELKWFNENQIPILYTFSFLTLYSLFGFLWAIVLLITLELVENNFELEITSDYNVASSDIKRLTRINTNKSHVGRPYSLNQPFDFDGEKVVYTEPNMIGNNRRHQQSENESQGLMNLIFFYVYLFLPVNKNKPLDDCIHCWPLIIWHLMVVAVVRPSIKLAGIRRATLTGFD